MEAGVLIKTDPTNYFKEINVDFKILIIMKNNNIELMNGQLIIKVTFNTIQDTLLLPEILFVDTKSMSVIGFAPRI